MDLITFNARVIVDGLVSMYSFEVSSFRKQRHPYAKIINFHSQVKPKKFHVFPLVMPLPEE